MNTLTDKITLMNVPYKITDLFCEVILASNFKIKRNAPEIIRDPK